MRNRFTYVLLICLIALMLLFGMGCRSESNVIAFGPCRIDSDSGGIRTVFALTESDDDQLVLRVNAPIAADVWVAEIGQTRPTSIYSKFFASIGNLLVIESEDGASMLRLTLIQLSSDGGYRTVYDNKSRFGWHLVDIDGDFSDEVVQVAGDNHGRKDIAIYKWDGESFVHLSKMHSDTFPTFDILIQGSEQSP